MDNLIKKAAQTGALPLDDEQLKKINAHVIKPLTADEVYTFKVAMCDNEIDRAYEAFDAQTLVELARLFDGKTVISDHERKSENQVARIYGTELISPGGNTTYGETYKQLVAFCYMLRTDTNKDLIAEIDAGIKREVSVGCAIGSVVCNICGADNRKVWCEHYPGREYDKKQCYFTLKDATDAYELSFVAVPCQRMAGITKEYGATSPKTEKKSAVSAKLKMLSSFIFIEKERE